LVKGLARGLGFSGLVHSPTFALLNVYTGGRLSLFHLDLYRLETLEQIIAAGLEEYLQPAGVTVIEWADKWFGKFPKDAPAENTPPTPTPAPGRPPLFRWVQLEPLSETQRQITYEDFGT
jgi:tRNA threonylcarbamoyladenosine biosynthesis protein TsaE